MLAVQALVSGWALGAHALPARTDILGNVLCTPEGAVKGGSGGQPAVPHLPACCTAGCLMLGGYLPPPPLPEAAPAIGPAPLLARLPDRGLPPGAGTGDRAQTPRGPPGA